MREGSLRERKIEEAKRNIYTIAMNLFAEKGFDATSIDEIVEKANVSRSTYFNYFQTKEGVLRYYGVQLQAKINRFIRDLPQSERALQNIHQLYTMILQEAIQNKRDVKLIYLYSLHDTNYLSKPTDSRAELLTILNQLIKKGQSTSEIRSDIDSYFLVLHVMSVIQGAIIAYVMDRITEADVLESTWNFIVGGLCHETHPTS